MNLKRCGKCGVTRQLIEFSKARRKYDGLQWRCKFCERVENRERNDFVKSAVFTLYGNKCEDCGSDGGRDRRLDFHHINFNGHNEDGGRNGSGNYLRSKLYALMKKGAPRRADLALLCPPCHHARHRPASIVAHWTATAAKLAA